MPPFHTTDRGRRVAASSPVTPRTLALLAGVDELAPSVEERVRRATDAQLEAAGWRLDPVVQVLDRAEPAVVAAHDDVFDRCRQALWSYEHVSPSIVRAAWHEGTPLLGRRLAQEGRFGPLRLPMATEVSVVAEPAVREVAGRPVRVAGWEYRTLVGHLEAGWQHWSVWRWLDTGVLEHRGHTCSRRAPDAGAVLGLGMRVFGRSMQLLAGAAVARRLADVVRGVGGVPDDVRPAPRGDAAVPPVRPLRELPDVEALDDVVLP